jgi:prepilin-type N-terminal cleavage/methylation domain-containing protein
MQSSFSSKRNSNQAFTLIELLVVIAIIAILAAILFPVFAQAKVAAKGAASLSNAKQTALATIMYSADVDDYQVTHANMNDATAPADNSRPWGQLLLPYMKSANLFQDPLSTPYVSTLTNQNDNYTYYTQFAYVYQVHAPVIYTGTAWISTPSSQTTLGAPANTVLLVTNHKYAENGTTNWTFGAGIGLRTAVVVGVPRCETTGYTLNPQAICGPGLHSWGIGSYDSWTNTDINIGALTAGVSARKAGQTVACFADGHAAMMAPARLAQGTNFSPTQNQTALVINDVNKYMWDSL